MSYYVYILLCEDSSYYTGHTKDVERRFEQHSKGLGSRYTKIHKPVRILYVEECGSLSQAMERERQIKTLGHSQKQQLATR
ncbi:MAG: GIY-YIG nuclease family protein [Candidatus Bathyarchaeota archaeon]|nr:GIY-YIG nuclease family protein [Candidatus Bathyarchaeota archaeon]MDH5689293.1 GIY-YIG nuclease family protein [Candidatus Bathyarchaeota archaeon]